MRVLPECDCVQIVAAGSSDAEGVAKIGPRMSTGPCITLPASNPLRSRRTDHRESNLSAFRFSEPIVCVSISRFELVPRGTVHVGH